MEARLREKSIFVFSFLALIATAAEYHADTGFALGIYGPITQITQDDLAAAALFDIDLRKHREPALRERFGPPIVSISNLHPDLKIKVQVGATDGQKTTGVATALDWLYGLNGSQKVVGIVGGYFSSLAVSIASNCEVFKTPQVAWGASHWHLSDKALYPWFLRTFPADTSQSLAIWAWMTLTEVRSVVFFYKAGEVYSEGLFQFTSENARAIGQPGRVSAMEAELTGTAIDRDVASLITTVHGIKTLGTKVIIMVFAAPWDATFAMYVMEQQGMLYSTYQILGSDAFGIFPGFPLQPSQGYPQGCMKVMPMTAGTPHSRFANTWHSMTPEDVYGPEARQRYMIDSFRAPLDAAATAKLQASDFANRLPWPYSNFLFDAAYSFVIAINNLLNSGRSPYEIHGEVLLTELRSLSFEGVTGPVAFDQNADRITKWEFWNARRKGGPLEPTALWNPSADGAREAFQFHDANMQELVWITGDVSVQAPKELIACTLGQRWDETAGMCLPCQRNEKASQDEMEWDPSCKPCGLGSISEQPLGALNCTQCPAGTYRDSSLLACTPCAAGTFMAEAGASACSSCPAGRYSPGEGAENCDICGGSSQPSRFTTMERVRDSNGEQILSIKLGADSASFCGCRQFFREDGKGGCLPCTEGVVCQGLNETSIARGYYADFVSLDGALSVFKCFRESKRCPGGPPGRTCASGRHGLACARCRDGLTPQSDGSCVDCKRSDLGPLIAVVAAGILALAGAYYLIDTQNRVTQSHAFLLGACAIGQLVTATQQLGVVGNLAVIWEEPMTSLLKVVKLLALDLEILRLSCVSNVNAWEMFCLKISIIFMTIGLMLAIHVCSVGLRYKCQWWKRHHAIVGSIGMLFMVFNIAVTSTVLEPYECEHHPNGKWTMQAYPSMLCWESNDDHTRMLVAGAVAFLLVPVFFLVACLFILNQFPKRMKAGDSTFLQAYAFLFFRFRPSQHWYVFYQQLRNFSVALVLLIPDAASQVFVLAVILLAGLCATLHLQPWRVGYANVLDCLFGVCSLLVVCLAGVFLDSDEKHLTGIAWLTFFITCGGMLCAPLAIMYSVYWKYCRWKKPFQFFLCHHKNGSGAFVRLLKLHLHDSPQLSSDIFVDSDNLENLDCLFDHVSNDTDNLAVICTAMIFTRPWCVGEMCVARLREVNVMLVALPSHAFPDEAFIGELSQRIADMEVLTENGISEEIIADTLRWIAGNPTIHVPAALSHQIMDTLTLKMVLKEPADLTECCADTKQAAEGKEPGQNMMLFDASNMEASSTALILRRLLIPHFSHSPMKIPQMIDENGSQVPASSGDIGAVVVVCTKGIFESPAVARFLIQISNALVTFLPLICEQSFSVPRRDIAKSLHNRRTLTEALGDQDELDLLASIVTAMFKEIAIHFDAQYSSVTVLDVAARALATRVLAAKALGTASNPSCGSNSLLHAMSHSASTMAVAAKGHAEEWSGQLSSAITQFASPSGSTSVSVLASGSGSAVASPAGQVTAEMML